MAGSEETIRTSVDQTIICISDLFWDEHWSSEQQLMSRLAKQWRVLYVERPVSVFSFFTGISDASVARQFLRWLRGGLRAEGDNLFVLTPPPFLPFRYYPIINTINQFVRTWSIKRAMKKLSLIHPLLWIYEPDAAYSVGRLDEVLSIYHCADDWTASHQWWNSTNQVRVLEEKLLRKATVVFATSRTLYEQKKPLAQNIYYMPNGVAASDFLEPREIPSDMTQMPRPILGCVALFNDRYDYESLWTVAKDHANWTFVFIGKLTAKGGDVDRLRHLPNVQFLGNRLRSRLGDYIQHCDVCLIPYKLTEFNMSAFPLKLMEYFFYGKPVVSSRVSSLKAYADLLYEYDHSDGLAAAILAALAEHGSVKAAKRREIARENTWEKRVEQIVAILRVHLDGAKLTVRQ